MPLFIKSLHPLFRNAIFSGGPFCLMLNKSPTRVDFPLRIHIPNLSLFLNPYARTIVFLYRFTSIKISNFLNHCFVLSNFLNPVIFLIALFWAFQFTVNSKLLLPLLPEKYSKMEDRFEKGYVYFFQVLDRKMLL